MPYQKTPEQELQAQELIRQFVAGDIDIFGMAERAALPTGVMKGEDIRQTMRHYGGESAARSTYGLDPHAYYQIERQHVIESAKPYAETKAQLSQINKYRARIPAESVGQADYLAAMQGYKYEWMASWSKEKIHRLYQEHSGRTEPFTEWDMMAIVGLAMNVYGIGKAAAALIAPIWRGSATEMALIRHSGWYARHAATGITAPQLVATQQLAGMGPLSMGKMAAAEAAMDFALTPKTAMLSIGRAVDPLAEPALRGGVLPIIFSVGGVSEVFSAPLSFTGGRAVSEGAWYRSPPRFDLGTFTRSTAAEVAMPKLAFAPERLVSGVPKLLLSTPLPSTESLTKAGLVLGVLGLGGVKSSSIVMGKPSVSTRPSPAFATSPLWMPSAKQRHNPLAIPSSTQSLKPFISAIPKTAPPPRRAPPRFARTPTSPFPYEERGKRRKGKRKDDLDFLFGRYKRQYPLMPPGTVLRRSVRR